MENRIYDKQLSFNTQTAPHTSDSLPNKESPKIKSHPPEETWLHNHKDLKQIPLHRPQERDHLSLAEIVVSHTTQEISLKKTDINSLTTLASATDALEKVIRSTRKENACQLIAYLEPVIKAVHSCLDSCNPEDIDSNLKRLKMFRQEIERKLDYDITKITCWAEFTATLWVANQRIKNTSSESGKTVIVGDYKVKLSTPETGAVFRQTMKTLDSLELAISRTAGLEPKEKTSRISKAHHQALKVFIGHGLGSQALANLLCTPPTEGVSLSPEQARAFGHSPYSDTSPPSALHSPVRSRNATPLHHTQVILQGRDKPDTYLTANHIYLDGQYSGIIMQAPRPEELEHVIRMILEHNVAAILDLTDTSGRERCKNPKNTKRKPVPVLEWRTMKSCYPVGSYNLDFSKEQANEWNVNDTKYFLYHRNCQILCRESKSILGTFQVLNFSDWPDRTCLPPDLLCDLVEAVNNILARPEYHYEGTNDICINCLAGLGRSSTFMAVKEILRKSKHTDLDIWKVGQLTLDTITQLRISRSGEAVQTHQQAACLLQIEENLYKKRKREAGRTAR